MATALRISHDRSLQIQSKLLNPRIACGLMFTKILPYQGNDVFREVMSTYGFHQSMRTKRPPSCSRRRRNCCARSAPTRK